LLSAQEPNTKPTESIRIVKLLSILFPFSSNH